MSTGDDVLLLSEEANEFYDHIRGVVVIFLFYFVLFSVSYVIIQLFREKNCVTETYGTKDDACVHQIVIGVCAFNFTISMAGFFLLPFSIIANEILILSPHSYYIQWLNTELVKDLFLSVLFGSKLGCFLVPFSFFLLESQSVRRGSNAIWSRLWEATSYLVLGYAAVLGLVWTVTSLLSLLFMPTRDSSPVASIGYSTTMTNMSIWTGLGHIILFAQFSFDSLHIVVSYFGLIVLLACMPFGIVGIVFRLIMTIMNSRPETVSRFVLVSKLQALEAEDAYIVGHLKLLLYLNRLHLPFRYRVSEGLDYLHLLSNTSYRKSLPPLASHSEWHHNLSSLQERITALNTQLTEHHTYFFHCVRVFLFLIILIFLFCLLCAGVGYMFINIIRLCIGLLFFDSSAAGKLPYDADAGILTTLYTTYPLTMIHTGFVLGHHSASLLGHFGAFLQVLLVVFMLFTSLWGFYSSTLISTYLRPELHSTTLDKLVANIAWLLVLTSALPLQASLLGLTNLTYPLYSSTSTTTASDLERTCTRLSDVNPTEWSTMFSQPSAVSSDSSWFWSFWWQTNKAALSNTQLYHKHNLHKTCKEGTHDSNIVHSTSSTRSCTSDQDGGGNRWMSFDWIFNHFSEKRPDVCVTRESDASKSKANVVTRAPTDNTGNYLLWPSLNSRSFSIWLALGYNIGFLVTSVWLASNRLRPLYDAFRAELSGFFTSLGQHHLSPFPE